MVLPGAIRAQLHDCFALSSWSAIHIAKTSSLTVCNGVWLHGEAPPSDLERQAQNALKGLQA